MFPYSGTPPPPPPPYTGYHHIVSDTITRSSPKVAMTSSPAMSMTSSMAMSTVGAGVTGHSGMMRLSQQLDGKLTIAEDLRSASVLDADIYPKILVQRSASQTGHRAEAEIYPKTVIQRSSSQASQILEDIYPHLKMQRSSSGGRLDEIYPKILMQRSTSQMSQPRSVSQLSQITGDHEIYPNLIRAQRGSTPLSSTLEDVTSIYPRILASNGKLIQVQTTDPLSQLSQQQIDEIYPKLLKQQLNSSVQLSQLPGAQLSASALTQQHQIHQQQQLQQQQQIHQQQQEQLKQHQLQQQSKIQQQQKQQQLQHHQQQQLLLQQQLMQQQYLQSQYEAEELPVYENVYENIVVNNQGTAAYNNQLDYVNLPPPPPYPGTDTSHLNNTPSSQVTTNSGLHVSHMNNTTSGHVNNATSGHVNTTSALHVSHVRNLSDTSGQSESSSGSILSHKSPGARMGWYETEIDSSSDTLTPVRAHNGHVNGGNGSPHLRPALLPHTLPAKPISTSSSVTNTPQTPAKPLLPFSVTPPRPPGPSEAEIKVEALTKQLEEEMEKKEQQSEFFGACHACNEKVTGAGQACQVRKNNYITKIIDIICRPWVIFITRLALFAAVVAEL